MKGFIKKRNESGITLIALVITIIVLLILAGVTIATLTGENGILARAAQSNTYNDIAQTKEQIKLELMTMAIEKDINDAGKYTKADVITAVKTVTGNDVAEREKVVKSKKGNDVNIVDLWAGAKDIDTSTTIAANKVEGKNVGDTVEWDPIDITTQESITSKVTENGYGDQVIYKQDTEWSILSKTDKTVTLISSTILGTKIDGTGGFGIMGAVGWLNAEKELNRICKALYGTESLTVEEVNAACGYTPNLSEKSTTSEVYFPQIGGTAYEGINNVAKGIYTRQAEMTNYYYVMVNQSGANASRISTLISDSGISNLGYCWLASRDVSIDSDNAIFSMKFAGYGLVNDVNSFFEGSTSVAKEGRNANGLRPAVTLTLK